MGADTAVATQSQQMAALSPASVTFEDNPNDPLLDTTLLERYREIYTAGARVGDPDAAVERELVEKLVPRLAAEHGLDDTSRMLTSGRDPALCLVRR